MLQFSQKAKSFKKRHNLVIFGLVGKRLSHSYSKTIHELISSVKYDLIEVEDIDRFLLKKPFNGINITIPYKTNAIKYCDVVDDISRKIGNVNTIINKNGTLYGYNTDYHGLKTLLSINNITIKDSSVLIIGNGSTSRLTEIVCTELNAKIITVIARNPKDNQDHIKNYSKYKNYDIIFNTTPYGMSPNYQEEPLFSILEFKNLKAVIDLIYNPIHSPLLIESKSLNIKAVNGLIMLIEQAIKANELFTNCSHNPKLTKEVYKIINQDKHNIVLIGMPMSGKSHYAKLLANSLKKDFIDMDSYIEDKEKESIVNIFAKKGEQHFRNLETSYYKEIAYCSGLIISTGGGIVENQEVMNHLSLNSVILFLDAPLSYLKRINPKNRPLLKTKSSIISLYNKRYPLYNQYADIIITKDTFDERKLQKEIEVALDEYFSA